jgi:uncharacterized protein YndB with AHSA1/START domain
MIAVQTEIRIERTIDDVFTYVADPENLPAWNSAVTGARPDGATGDAPSTFVLSRRLPTGVATNRLRIVAFEPPERFAIETTSGPTPFHYEFRFHEDGGVTVITLAAQADVGPAGSLLGPLARRGLASGIHANLTALKRILDDRAGRA